jgi:copper homeostasis protein
VTLLEVCLDDIQGAVFAERCGADRIELCANLDAGGTTPSIGTVATVLGNVQRIGVQVLVRQREGDFVYSPVELDAMCADIEAIRALPAPNGVEVGFVIGALTPHGTVDQPAVLRLMRAAGTASVTFHKAFDQTVHRGDALETLIDFGVHRVLTSGGASTAEAGADALAGLVGQAAGRIAILAGSGIRPHNVASIVARSGAPEVHLRAAAPTASAGAPNEYDSGSRLTTSPAMIESMLQALGRGPAL